MHQEKEKENHNLPIRSNSDLTKKSNGKKTGTNLLERRFMVGLKNKKKMPWLMWLSGLSAVLRSKVLLVGFPVRALAWVVGQVPSRGT